MYTKKRMFYTVTGNILSCGKEIWTLDCDSKKKLLGTVMD